MTPEEMKAAYKAESKAAAAECNAACFIASQARERELAALDKAMPHPCWGQGPGSEGDRYIDEQLKIERRYNIKEEKADKVCADRLAAVWYKYMPLPEAIKKHYYDTHPDQQPSLWD